MTALVVIFDILRDDVDEARSIQRKLIDELRRGRGKQQIYFEENLCFISTPEGGYELADRVISVSDLRPDKDNLVIIDHRSRKLYIWGVCDMNVCVQFETYKVTAIAKNSAIDI